MKLFYLFVSRFNVPVNFSVISGRSHRFLGTTSTFVAQGHNTAEVSFEPRPLAPESDALPRSHRAPPKRGVPYGAILFAYMYSLKNEMKMITPDSP